MTSKGCIKTLLLSIQCCKVLQELRLSGRKHFELLPSGEQGTPVFEATGSGMLRSLNGLLLLCLAAPLDDTAAAADSAPSAETLSSLAGLR